MTVYFVDTSALAKRYVSEAGSEWVKTLALSNSGHSIAVSQIALVEMASVLARHARNGALIPSVADAFYTTFLLHMSHEYMVIPVSEDVLVTSKSLLFTHRLRSLDAIHLAFALLIQENLESRVHFVCSDTQLLSAARQEGLIVDNPLDHIVSR